MLNIRTVRVATKIQTNASSLYKGLHVDTSLKLLKDKRASAYMDALKMEMQLARLTESAEAIGIRTNLRSIAHMFRDHIDMLDEAIASATSGAARQSRDIILNS